MVQGKVSYAGQAIALFALLLSPMLAVAPPAFAVIRHSHMRPGLVGPKTYYLALGDSLAYGFQPDFDWTNGYANYFADNLQNYGVKMYVNLACPGETTITMIKGGCPYSLLHKYVYAGPQLAAAVTFLRQHTGQVSPVTLDIGANDLLPDLNTANCLAGPHWARDLATEDYNLKHIILPRLIVALTVDGHVSGDLLLMNYYDPFQNNCPNTMRYIREFNWHLAADARGLATIVNVFTPFSGSAPINPHLCNYTWICSVLSDIHAKDAGYELIANAFERTTGY
jgi:lysophospholipase L1-like esterase